MKHKIIQILNSQKAFFIAATVVLIAVFFSFVYQVKLLQTQGNFAEFPKNPDRPVMAASTNTVQSWMTFNYLSKIYRIPPSYFQQTLNIPAAKYHHLSVYNYAKMSGLPVQTAVEKVQTAIWDYRSK